MLQEPERARTCVLVAIPSVSSEWLLSGSNVRSEGSVCFAPVDRCKHHLAVGRGGLGWGERVWTNLST